MKNMNCPRCKTDLQKVVIPELNKSIEVDQCNNCKGIWFDYGELQSIEKVVEPVLFEFRKIPRKNDQLIALNCPFCDLHPRMNKAEHPRDHKVVMDVCEHCNGIWLDGGELEAIQKENWWSAITGLIRKIS